ncbi:hypothetical protein CEXT_176391 [Caerostris extrusa]|uniref:Uncharacterized protein n=1 Tax=Caerostris extrusa TaxID=172846 RepID=A0AAV4WMB5_CAEEX|nr:hypothetical protein CEXT_176391 [Caerostris extrusa]
MKISNKAEFPPHLTPATSFSPRRDPSNPQFCQPPSYPQTSLLIKDGEKSQVCAPERKERSPDKISFISSSQSSGDLQDLGLDCSKRKED